MTITKAIALAALTGTLAIGPQAAFAQSTDHGKSDAAHSRNESRKSEHAATKADREATRDAAKAERETAKETRAEERATAKQERATERENKVNFGQVISTIRTGGDLSEISGLTGDVDVTVIDIEQRDPRQQPCGAGERAARRERDGAAPDARGQHGRDDCSLRRRRGARQRGLRGRECPGRPRGHHAVSAPRTTSREPLRPPQRLFSFTAAGAPGGPGTLDLHRGGERNPRPKVRSDSGGDSGI